MAEALTFKAADSSSIPALYFRRGGRRLLVVSHGITADKTEDGVYYRLIDRLPSSYDVLLFDFRGHGDSDQSSLGATVCGEVLDLMAVLKWSEGAGFPDVDHLATSFGASIALLALSAYGPSLFRRVVFWNPVTNYRTTFFDPGTEWSRDFFGPDRTRDLAYRSDTCVPDSEFQISAIMSQELLLLHPECVRWPKEVPLLIIHGDRDTVVSLSDSTSFANANGVELKVLQGVDHGFDHLLDEAIKLSVQWLQR